MFRRCFDVPFYHISCSDTFFLLFLRNSPVAFSILLDSGVLHTFLYTKVTKVDTSAPQCTPLPYIVFCRHLDNDEGTYTIFHHYHCSSSLKICSSCVKNLVPFNINIYTTNPYTFFFINNFHKRKEICFISRFVMFKPYTKRHIYLMESARIVFLKHEEHGGGIM